MDFRRFGSLLKETGRGWWNDKAPRLGAALAFYTVLSLAPLLIIVVGIAGLAFGEQAAQGHIVAQIEDLVGVDGARLIQTILKNANEPAAGIIATVVGLVGRHESCTTSTYDR